MANGILTPDLIQHLQAQLRLEWQGIHGPARGPALLREAYARSLRGRRW